MGLSLRAAWETECSPKPIALGHAGEGRRQGSGEGRQPLAEGKDARGALPCLQAPGCTLSPEAQEPACHLRRGLQPLPPPPPLGKQGHMERLLRSGGNACASRLDGPQEPGPASSLTRLWPEHQSSPQTSSSLSAPCGHRPVPSQRNVCFQRVPRAC